MRKRNCPNCGAPYEVDKNKCPYCSTSYYDMSAIDFESGEPFYLKIKTKWNGQDVYITQLVRPILNTIEVTTDTTDYIGKYGEKLHSYVSNRELTTNVGFIGIPDKNGNLMTMTIEE